MHKTVFIKYVYDAEHADSKARFAVLTREAELPFAPVPGQEIQWPLIRSQKLVQCIWDVERQSFRCQVENDYTVNARVDAPDFDETVEQAPEDGWSVSAVHPASR